ncbi:MAG: hypothetical protein IH874_01045 [Candidatus Dadabacteria bacterium]|nr:hypothetical protein [Candidatus Dadabacteria bacterium]
MNKTNIPGGLVVTLVLCCLVGYAIFRGVSLEWDLFFRVSITVVAIAAVTGILAFATNKS